MMQKMNKGKLLAAVAVFAMVFAVFAAVPSVDAADTTYISGEVIADTQFGVDTVVVVNGDLNIKNGADLIIGAGATFTINEGVKVTVDGLTAADAAALKENPDAVVNLAGILIHSDARVIINGDVVIGEYGTITNYIPVENPPLDLENFYPGVFNYGTITAQKGGVLDVSSFDLAVMDGGIIDITSTGVRVSEINGEVYMMAGATLNIKGHAGNLNIYTLGIDLSKNYTVFEDYEILGANVDFYGNEKGENHSKVSELTFTVTTEKITAYQPESVKTEVLVSDIYVNGIVQGDDELVVDETQESDLTLFADKKLTQELAAIESAVIVDESLVMKGGELNVDGKLDIVGAIDITKDATIYIGEAFITVFGTLDIQNNAAPAKNNIGGSNDYYSTLYIDGGVVTVSNVRADTSASMIDDFYGAYYQIDTETGTNFVACDLAAAMTVVDGIKVDSVYVYGLNESALPEFEGAYQISEDLVIAENVTLYVFNGLYVPEEYNVTVDGTIDANGKIIVDGKLRDNVMDLSNAVDGEIVSEVVLVNEEEAYQIFTSLRLALKDAVQGETINLSTSVDVNEDLVIPAGITVDAGTHTIIVEQEQVLTVDGILDIKDGALITQSATEDKVAGLVVVNNIIIRAADDVFDVCEGLELHNEFNVPGVYTFGEIGDVYGNLIVALAVFEDYAGNMDDSSVQGPVQYADAITLAAGEDGDNTLEIMGTVVFTGTVTLVDYTINIIDNGELTAKLASTNGAVQLTKVEGISVYNITDSEEQTDDLIIKGTVAENLNAKGTESVSIISLVSGTVVAEDLNTINLKEFGIGAGTTLAVDTTLTTSDLVIYGTVIVGKTGEIVATDYDITVMGTLSVAEDATKTVAADVIFVGITGKETLGVAAVIDGTAIDFKLMYVAAGSTVDSELTDGLKSTAIEVEDTLWVTVYAVSDAENLVIYKPAVKNADFEYWVDEDGDVVDMTVAKVGAPAVIFAVIDYNIYDVEIVADNGIGTVSVDGIVLKKVSNVFAADGLKAGTHTIAIELKNGYEGTVQMTVNGQIVSGYTFTLDGTDLDDRFVEITLNGTAPAEPVAPEKDDGMGLTDYLLIVLVILVVIMAVLVAMRLMRS